MINLTLKKMPSKKIQQFLLVLSFFIWTAGCGKGTPPASIPAPVAGLIVSSSPGEDGKARVTGTDGSVEADATVRITNNESEEETEADGDGAFVIEIDADIGNTLEITQAAGDETSDATSVEVPEGAPPTDNPPLKTAVIPSNNLGYIFGTDGTDTLIDVFDLVTFNYITTILVPDFAAVDGQADDSAEEGYLVDKTNGAFLVVDEDGSVKAGAILVVDSPSAVAANQDNDFAIIGHEASANSLTYADNTGAAPSLEDTLLITHPTDGGASHEDTFSLSSGVTALGTAVTGALSRFDNGDTVFSLVTANDTPPYAPAVVEQNNLGSGTYDTVVLFNEGSEAIVSDRGANRILRLSGSDFLDETVIDVGEAPRGIAVDESNQIAFVANSGDHTISVIDLDTSTINTTFDSSNAVGLTPVALSLDENVGGSPVLVVANQESQTASLILIVFE